MERKAKITEPDNNFGKIWFKREEHTHGLFEYEGRYIKPGQRFMARPEEIPPTIRDIIVPMEDIPDQPLAMVAAPKYHKLPGKKKGMFNVVDGQGKVVNETLLTEEDADALVNALG